MNLCFCFIRVSYNFYATKIGSLIKTDIPTYSHIHSSLLCFVLYLLAVNHNFGKAKMVDRFKLYLVCLSFFELLAFFWLASGPGGIISGSSWNQGTRSSGPRELEFVFFRFGTIEMPSPFVMGSRKKCFF